MSTTYCPNCGTEIESGLKCPGCGIIDEHCSSCDTKFEEGDWLCPSCSTVRDHCPECGTRVEDDTCPSCGETKPAEIRAKDYGPTDKYSPLQWLGAGAVGLFTFPIGLVVPGYLYYKCKNGGAIEQSALETWTVVLMSIIGIVAVELGGRKGAMISWGAFVSLMIGLVLLV
jgi:hypothetical protein